MPSPVPCGSLSSQVYIVDIVLHWPGVTEAPALHRFRLEAIAIRLEAIATRGGHCYLVGGHRYRRYSL